VRLYRRYASEIVEASDLCPWAERARRQGRTRERVLLQPDSENVMPSLQAIIELAASDVDVALLIYPRLHMGRGAFERFAGRIRDADVGSRELGSAPFVAAVFHPEAQPDMSEPERLVPVLRRTPDPTIQLLRGSVLDRVRESIPQGTQFFDPQALEALHEPQPSLRERIAKANLITTVKIGVDTLTRRMDDIVHDRQRSYGALVQYSEQYAEPTHA